MSQPAVTISRLPAAELDALEPLWSALREHHGALQPQWGPTRDRADSWAFRRGQYEEWLGRDGSFVLIARAGGDAVGYALVKIDGPSPIWPGERSGSLETLSVLPSARGAGLGGQLITEARAGLAAQGITNMTIDVLHSNDDALRFYARHGFDACVVSLVGPTTNE